jgi:membrane-bound lytic murein transglycosylase B
VRFGWLLTGLAALALGPAVAQTDPLAPLPEQRPSSTSRPSPQPATPAWSAPRALQQPQTLPVQSQASGFEAYKIYLAAKARGQGVSDATARAHIPTLRLNARAMELDRAQRPSSSSTQSGSIEPLAPYLRTHVTPQLISGGRSRYSFHWPRLSQINAQYGVDPAVLIAIYGKETSYGAVTGSFDLLDALASLAYEGRRRQLFEAEFFAALKLIDTGVPRWRLKGSYAGATGYPQFMPSVVLRLRADGDGDGYADIWRSEADAFASIANYLRDAGWRAGVPWGSRASTPASLNRQALRSTLVPDRCPAVFRRHSRWLSVRDWRALGVVPSRALPDAEQATLLEPDGPGGGAYLLTSNYRAVLEYNCSNFYAMSVLLLADAIAGR